MRAPGETKAVSPGAMRGVNTLNKKPRKNPGRKSPGDAPSITVAAFDFWCRLIRGSNFRGRFLDLLVAIWMRRVRCGGVEAECWPTAPTAGRGDLHADCQVIRLARDAKAKWLLSYAAF